MQDFLGREESEKKKGGDVESHQLKPEEAGAWTVQSKANKPRDRK